MKQFGRLIAFSIAFVYTLLFFQNCSQFKGVEVASLANENSLGSMALSYAAGDEPPHMFGYFADAMTGVGKGDYLTETAAAGANVHFVSGEVHEIAQKMRKVKSLNSSAILMLQNQIYDWKTVRLQANSEYRVREVRDLLQTEGTLSSVVGIYVIDEPYFINDLSKGSDKLDPSIVYQNLSSGADLVKKYFGNNVLILSSEAYPILDSHLIKNNWPAFPPNYNLIAVNCYLSFGPICDTEAKYRKYIDILASALKSNQRLFLTLDNYWPTTASTSATIQQSLIARTNLQVQIAKEKNITVLVSFLYQSQPAEVDPLYGLESMPTLFSHVRNISAHHLNKVSTTPTPVPSPSQPTPTPTPPSGNPTGCPAQSAVLVCSVEGIQQHVSVQINGSGSVGATTSSVSLPSEFTPVRFDVQWTCQSNGQWVFSHANGFCSLKKVASIPAPAPNPAPVPEPVPEPAPEPPKTSNCSPQSSALVCTVDGVQQHISVQINSSGTIGATTSSVILPSNFTVERLDVQWTCQSSGQWAFSHPNGFCSLKKILSPPTCLPQQATLLCTVNGVQQNVPISVNASGPAGAKTANYVLPSGYSPSIMTAEWTCQTNGSWQFSHPNGWCALNK